MTDENNGNRFDSRGMDLVYRQVAGDIERRIRAGEFGYGDRLPSRDELARHYGVAVMTVRRAQTDLAGRGLVRIVTGKGTYVVWSPEGTPGAHNRSE